MKSTETPATAPDFIRMELSYCERCGALRIQPANCHARFCAGCSKTLAWIGAEARR